MGSLASLVRRAWSTATPEAANGLDRGARVGADRQLRDGPTRQRSLRLLQLGAEPARAQHDAASAQRSRHLVDLVELGARHAVFEVMLDVVPEQRVDDPALLDLAAGTREAEVTRRPITLNTNANRR